jgi:hypothetical protein
MTRIAGTPNVSSSSPAHHAAPLVKNLGQLAAPGTKLGDTTQTLTPGQGLRFKVAGNQITGIVGFQVEPASGLKVADKQTGSVNGVLGHTLTHQFTFTVGKDVKPGTVFHITSEPTYQARNDKKMAFSFDIKVA